MKLGNKSHAKLLPTHMWSNNSSSKHMFVRKKEERKKNTAAHKHTHTAQRQQKVINNESCVWCAAACPTTNRANNVFYGPSVAVNLHIAAKQRNGVLSVKFHNNVPSLRLTAAKSCVYFLHCAKGTDGWETWHFYPCCMCSIEKITWHLFSLVF